MQAFIPSLLSSSTWVVNDILHEYFSVMVNFLIIILEFIGLIVIAFSAVKAVLSWLKKEPETRLKLEEGLDMALSFMLGGEILRTVVVSDMAEIIHVGAIIVLRVALTFLIHWEIKNEKKELNEHSAAETTPH